jgi:predicted amidohydrolase YtcJ
VKKNQVSKIFKNGVIYTLDHKFPWAQVMVSAADRLVYVGPDEGIQSWMNAEVEVIDLEGRLVLPSFVDAHAHPSHAVDYFENISLYQLTSITVEMVGTIPYFRFMARKKGYWMKS